MLKKNKLLSLFLIVLLIIQNVGCFRCFAAEEVSDSISPSAPINLSYIVNDNKNIELSWEASTDNIKIAGYEIYKDGIKVGTTTECNYKDVAPDELNSTEYYIKAYDEAGNLSSESNHIILKRNEDTTLIKAVSASAIKAVSASAINVTYKIQNDKSILLTWSIQNDGDAISKYEIYRNGNIIGTTQETSFIDTELNTEELQTYTIFAYDSSCELLIKSEQITVNLQNNDISEDYSLNIYNYRTDRYIIKYKNENSNAKLKKYMSNDLKSTHLLKSKKDEKFEVIILNKKMKPDDFIAKIKNKKIKSDDNVKDNEIKTDNTDQKDANNSNTNTNIENEFDFSEDIEYIQPDYEFVSSSLDPLFNQQWGILNSTYVDTNKGLNNTPSDVLPNEDTVTVTPIITNDSLDSENSPATKNDYVDANVINAWDSTKGDGTVVGVLDTGIDITQEDLNENVWVNTQEIPGNYIDDDGNGYIDDVNGWNFVDDTNQLHDEKNVNDEWHGTHIAGIIAAQDNNNIGISGVAPDSKIMPLKVFHNGIALTSDIIEAINYAEKMGVKIVNCSWGSTSNNQALKEAIDNSNMLFVCASGNDHVNIDETPIYPASYDSNNIISVASIGQNGILSSFSNYGENSVDVTAPGEDIISAYPENKYVSSSGTSMSAAFVSGEAALILSKNMNFDAFAIKKRTIDTSDKLSSLTGKILDSNKINVTNSINNVMSDKLITISTKDNNNYSNSNTNTQSDNTLYSTGYWSTKASCPVSASARSITMMGKIFSFVTSSKTVYQYDPSTNAWTQIADMNLIRNGVALATVNGKLYAIGGNSDSGNLNSIEEYNPATNTWLLKANMPTARQGACAAVIDNMIYVIGGVNDNGTTLNTVEAYNPFTDQWTAKANMTTARLFAGASVLNGKIYVAGGLQGGNFFRSMEMYDPITNSWALKASMSVPRFLAGYDSLNGKMYAFGGFYVGSSYNLLNSVEAYSDITNTWVTCESMPTARYYLGVAAVNNSLYAIGGSTSGSSTNIVECYTPLNIPDVEYVYDVNGRLVEIKCSGISKAKFIYDKNGNLLSINLIQ